MLRKLARQGKLSIVESVWKKNLIRLKYSCLDPQKIIVKALNLLLPTFGWSVKKVFPKGGKKRKKPTLAKIPKFISKRKRYPLALSWVKFDMLNNLNYVLEKRRLPSRFFTWSLAFLRKRNSYYPFMAAKRAHTRAIMKNRHLLHFR